MEIKNLNYQYLSKNDVDLLFLPSFFIKQLLIDFGISVVLYRGQKVNADWSVMYFRIEKDEHLLKWFSSFRITIKIFVDI